MDTPMSHSEFEELAAGYVLGALEPDDEHDFQRHLDGCDTCEATVRELEAVAGELAYAAPPVDPPDTLWAGIRREIRSEAVRPEAVPQAPAPAQARAPAPARARVASAVATLPAITCTLLDRLFTRPTAAATSALWPCAVSMTMQSTPASISAALRS